MARESRRWTRERQNSGSGSGSPTYVPTKAAWAYFEDADGKQYLDFHAAFGLGETPKGISTIDADGVALAAIQGLNAKVEEQQREITELKRMLLKMHSMIEMKAAMH